MRRCKNDEGGSKRSLYKKKKQQFTWEDLVWDEDYHKVLASNFGIPRNVFDLLGED